MSNLLDHAKRELALVGYHEAEMGDPKDMDTMMYRGILDMVFNFSEQGHSGASAAYQVSILEKLLRFQNLSPLTRNPDEWMHIDANLAGDAKTWQSLRNSACFSRDGGLTYYHLDEKQRWTAHLLRKLPHKIWVKIWDEHPNWVYKMHRSEPGRTND